MSSFNNYHVQECPPLQRLTMLKTEHQALIHQRNIAYTKHNGIFQRWRNPVITAEHVPLEWRYDFSTQTNPFMQERIAVNATFNAGAIKLEDKYLVVVRVEGADRKSYFAVAESKNGVDGFEFWSRPVNMTELYKQDTNIYDMRLTQHEDGFIYGLFCTERKKVFIYYASSDTRLHVATTSVERLLDYCKNTPEDGNSSAKSVQAICSLIDRNERISK